MSKFPETYEKYLALSLNSDLISQASEIDFYKEGYKVLLDLYESNMQVSKFNYNIMNNNNYLYLMTF